jgi:hypothetical protein
VFLNACGGYVLLIHNLTSGDIWDWGGFKRSIIIHNQVGLEVLAVLRKKTAVFWVVEPCNDFFYVA